MRYAKKNFVPLEYARPHSPEKSKPLRWIWLASTIVCYLAGFLALAALVTLLLPRFYSHFHPGRTTFISKPKADISNISTALKKFELENDRFPTTEEGLQALIANPGIPGWTKCLDAKSVPIDPWGHAYIYECPGTNGNDFDLYSAGPDGIPGTADDIRNDR